MFVNGDGAGMIHHVPLGTKNKKGRVKFKNATGLSLQLRILVLQLRIPLLKKFNNTSRVREW